MFEPLLQHPIAALFPAMSSRDFEILVEDIRQHGVKVPILVQAGQILDGRHRYQACQRLGIPCPRVEWTGGEPWFEVQSRNLMRRHLAADQICAIGLLATERFPQLTAATLAVAGRARQPRACPNDQPEDRRLPDGERAGERSADRLGALLGVSGSTVKRVNRLARLAPEFIPQVAAGKISVKKALRSVALRSAGPIDIGTPTTARPEIQSFRVEAARATLQQRLGEEWITCPPHERRSFLFALQQALRVFADEQHARVASRTATGLSRSGALAEAAAR